MALTNQAERTEVLEKLAAQLAAITLIAARSTQTAAAVIRMPNSASANQCQAVPSDKEKLF